jgi:hypothetical protein
VKKTGTTKWPTKNLPPAPKIKGDPMDWSEEDWLKFRRWAQSLKAYPDVGKKSVKPSAKP